MHRYPSDIGFTPSVKAIQTQKGSRSSYSRMEMGGSWETTVSEELRKFLAELDMFYLGTANAEAAARLLGLNRTTLQAKLKRYGLV